MRKSHKGITIVDVMVIIFALIFLIVIISPALKQFLRRSSRVVCVTNLKGLGTAINVYANDYAGEYPKLGHGPWSRELSYSYDDVDFNPHNYEGPCTITSSLYMLVREADVSPKSFVCPQAEQTGFDGLNSHNLDIAELWDLGDNPHKHVSYAYHNPYGKYPANESCSSFFATMADMSPWFKNGEIISPNNDKSLPPQIINVEDTATFKKSNSLNHTQYKEDFLYYFQRTRYNPYGFGQNVLFADGHTAFEKQPNVGVNNDNIYTFWSVEENPTDQDIQGGTAPTGRSEENDAKSETDSFLAI